MIVGIFDQVMSGFSVLGDVFTGGSEYEISHDPTARGAKTVAPDVYEGPDISPTTGAYESPGLDVLRADAAAAAAASAPAPRPSKPSSLPAWALPAGIFGLLVVGVVVMHRSKRR